MYMAQSQQSVSAHPSRGWNMPNTNLGKKTPLRSKLNYKSITCSMTVFSVWYSGMWWASLIYHMVHIHLSQHTEKGEANSSLLETNFERLWSLRPDTVPGWSSLQSEKVKCNRKWSTQREGVKSYIAMTLRSIGMKWGVSHWTRN